VDWLRLSDQVQFGASGESETEANIDKASRASTRSLGFTVFDLVQICGGERGCEDVAAHLRQP